MIKKDNIIESGNPDFSETKDILNQALDTNRDMVYLVQSQVFTTSDKSTGSSSWVASTRRKWENNGLDTVEHYPHDIFGRYEKEQAAKVKTSVGKSTIGYTGKIQVKTFYPAGHPFNYEADRGGIYPTDRPSYELLKIFDTMSCPLKFKTKVFSDEKRNQDFSSTTRKIPVVHKISQGNTITVDNDDDNVDPKNFWKVKDTKGFWNIECKNYKQISSICDQEKIAIAHNPGLKNRTKDLTGLQLVDTAYIPAGTDINGNANKMTIIEKEYNQMGQLITFSPKRAQSITSAITTTYNKVLYASVNMKGQGILSGPSLGYLGIPDGDTIWTDETFAKHYDIPEWVTKEIMEIAYGQ